MKKAELTTKHKDLLAKEGTLICTSDGQAFYDTKNGRNYARAHAASNKLEVIEIGDGTVEEADDVDVWSKTPAVIAKDLTVDQLKDKAGELGLEYDGTKKEMVAVILAELEAQAANE